MGRNIRCEYGSYGARLCRAYGEQDVTENGAGALFLKVNPLLWALVSIHNYGGYFLAIAKQFSVGKHQAV
ncbi:MAG: hypothetical protein AAFN09_04970 [Pseudomonadota bacterium]